MSSTSEQRGAPRDGAVEPDRNRLTTSTATTRRARPLTWAWCISAAGAAAATMLVVTVSATAFAHAGLLSSDPADGARLTRVPTVVSFRFTDPLTPGLAKVAVSRKGRAMTVGPPKVRGDRLSQPMPAGTGDGVYRIAYHVVSADGHPITGAITMTVSGSRSSATPNPTSPAVAAEASPTSQSRPPTAAESGDVGGDGSTQAGALVVGAGLVLLGIPAIVVVAVWRRRRGRGPEPEGGAS